jgi:FixJ family two-component response regulator
MIQSGKSNKEISNELNIEISTVKSHVNNLYSKLENQFPKGNFEYLIIIISSEQKP